MITFTNINEILDKPYKWKWTKKGKLTNSILRTEWKGEFQTDDGRWFDIQIANRWDGVLTPPVQVASVSFADRQHGTKMTGLGDMFRIMTTIGMMVKEFTEQNPKVVAIGFSAHGQGRTGVYRRIAKKLPGFEILSEKMRDVGQIKNAYSVFMLIRKGTKQLVKDAIAQRV